MGHITFKASENQLECLRLLGSILLYINGMKRYKFRCDPSNLTEGKRLRRKANQLEPKVALPDGMCKGDMSTEREKVMQHDRDKRTDRTRPIATPLILLDSRPAPRLMSVSPQGRTRHFDLYFVRSSPALSRTHISIIFIVVTRRLLGTLRSGTNIR